MAPQDDPTRDSVQSYAERWAAESPFVGEVVAEEKQAPIHPWYQGYTPFVEGLEEMYAPEAEWEAHLAVMEAESPFGHAFEQGRTSLSEPEELEEEFVEEDEAAWERGEFPEDEAEAYDEVAADLEGGIEELYDEEAPFWIEPEEEGAYSLEETPYEEEEPSLDEEFFIESEGVLHLFNPGAVVQRVQQLLGEGVFSLSLLGRFDSGQIWNEDHLALEILFHRQPRLRPAGLDTLPGPRRLGLLGSLAVKHQRELTPIRERIVRPIFGNPANFQVGPAEGCQIQDLREEVRKLGPLEAGKYMGKVYYKRSANQSPRKEAAIDSIVLHHMAYNIGNDVNSYKKVGAHYIVTADGRIAQLYDDLDFLNASDGFNPRSVAIEFAGNFPDHRYHWWKPADRTIPDRCYLTPAQIRAGRCLLATLKNRLPGIKYLYAHRQSSKDRPLDPGPDVWFNIGEWALANLNLTDRLPRTHIGTGQPIPENWRMSRPAVPATTVTPTPTPAKGAAKPQAELVRFAQRVLNAAEGERLSDDGDLGPLTRGALERFRGKYGLGAGGVLDDKTHLALAQRALEEIAQQSIFPQPGVLDAKTEQALITFKSDRGLGFSATLDAATRAALADALARRRVSVPSAPRPVATPSGLPKLGAGLTPPTDPTAYRKFRLTTYHVVDQRELPMGAVRVPIYDDNRRKIAEGSPEFFAQLSLEGTARLTDGRLINVTGKTVPVSHDEYAGVLAYHRQAYAKSDKKRREEGKKPTPMAYSGIVVENDRVVRAFAFHEVPASRRGIGYGLLRGIPLVPFRTLAADIGVKEKHDKNWKGKDGLVPPGTRVYIKEYNGLRLPDGTTHDGWFIVNDTGGAIFGAHFDVFVGTLALRKQVKLPEFGQVWFAGIEQRIPPGYTYGLKA